MRGFYQSLAPKYGFLDFQKEIETLKEIDYQGYVSVEILTMQDQGSAAEMTIEALNRLNI